MHCILCISGSSIMDFSMYDHYILVQTGESRGKPLIRPTADVIVLIPQHQYTHTHTPTYLKAGGNGSVLIVCSLRVSDQVVPAGEHLPAEGELSLLRPIPSFIWVTSHPEKRKRPEDEKRSNISTCRQVYLIACLHLCVLPYVLMTTIKLYPKMPTPTNRYDRGSLNCSSPIVRSLL